MFDILNTFFKDFHQAIRTIIDEELGAGPNIAKKAYSIKTNQFSKKFSTFGAANIVFANMMVGRKGRQVFLSRLMHLFYCRIEMSYSCWRMLQFFRAQ